METSDELWMRHCQRDFKRESPQEYESWREMYLRLHDEREERLRMLTQNISSAHANRPKGAHALSVNSLCAHSLSAPITQTCHLMVLVCYLLKGYSLAAHTLAMLAEIPTPVSALVSFSVPHHLTTSCGCGFVELCAVLPDGDTLH